MTTWTVKNPAGVVAYEGRSERKARRILDARKKFERTLLLCDGQLWIAAEDPPAVKTPESRRARGMVS